MKRFEAQQANLVFMLILSVFIIILPGCGGGGGGGGHWEEPVEEPVTPPRVTAVVPLNNATGVAINTKRITAAFSEAMDESTITSATFLVKETVSGTSVAGTVTYVQASRTATFAPTADLARDTQYTATITTGAKNPEGTSLESPFEWTFRTGVTPDTTRPRVTVTVPADAATGVATNTAITAVFTEDMAPATITGASFTVTGPGATPVAGDVSYAVGSRTAVFTPAAVLTASITYTATITTAATDVADNQLAGNQASLPAASNYVWTFTTGTPVPPANVSVLSVNPGAGAVAVCSNTSINLTFTVPSGLRMDPLTVTAATFTVTGPGATPVTASSVLLDAATGRIATFIPSSALTSGVLYTATIKSGATGVKDLAIPANTMASDFTWTFTAGPATVNCPAPEPLLAAAPFGFLSSAALTNEGNSTVIDGDAATTSAAASIVEFHDAGGRTYTEVTPLISGGLVTGTIYASDAPIGDPLGVGTTATAVHNAAQTAFNNLSPAGRPGGLDVTTNSLVNGPGNLPGELGGRTLAPGVYFSTVGTYDISGVGHTTDGDLTLDAQGNANAVWVFQTADGTGTLTVGVTGPAAPIPPVKVLLINGAQAKNVFWYVPAGATIGTGSTMVGTIISNASTTFSTAAATTLTTLEGRALVLTAGATMVNTVINVPAP